MMHVDESMSVVLNQNVLCLLNQPMRQKDQAESYFKKSIEPEEASPMDLLKERPERVSLGLVDTYAANLPYFNIDALVFLGKLLGVQLQHGALVCDAIYGR
jgi:hypothetical protein